LLNIYPAEIAGRTEEKGEARARDFGLSFYLVHRLQRFLQERSAGTVLRVELIGENKPLLKAFDHICGSYGMEKIKTIGDVFLWLPVVYQYLQRFQFRIRF